MEGISQTLVMWEKEALLVVALLAVIALTYSARRGWLWREGPSFMLILGTFLLILSAIFYFLRPLQAFEISDRASVFILLYLWCVLGMIFFTGSQTHPFKLILGLLAQAGILYALFLYT